MACCITIFFRVLLLNFDNFTFLYAKPIIQRVASEKFNGMFGYDVNKIELTKQMAISGSLRCFIRLNFSMARFTFFAGTRSATIYMPVVTLS